MRRAERPGRFPDSRLAPVAALHETKHDPEDLSVPEGEEPAERDGHPVRPTPVKRDQQPSTYAEGDDEDKPQGHGPRRERPRVRLPALLSRSPHAAILVCAAAVAGSRRGLRSKGGRGSLTPPLDPQRQGADAFAPPGVPLESAQEFLAQCIAAYPTEHPLVTQFKAVGVSRPVDLTDPADCAFALGVIEGWVAQVGKDQLPPGIRRAG